MAAVAALAIAAALITIVELATRHIERRHDERIRQNQRTLRELRDREQL